MSDVISQGPMRAPGSRDPATDHRHQLSAEEMAKADVSSSMNVVLDLARLARFEREARPHLPGASGSRGMSDRGGTHRSTRVAAVKFARGWRCLGALAALAALSSGAVRPPARCTCIGVPTGNTRLHQQFVREEFAGSDAVFIGEVVGGDMFTAKLAVRRTWKGPAAGAIVRFRQMEPGDRPGLIVLDTCRFTVSTGRLALVFANTAADGLLSASKCGASGSVEGAATALVLAALNEVAPSARKTIPPHEVARARSSTSMLMPAVRSQLLPRLPADGGPSVREQIDLEAVVGPSGTVLHAQVLQSRDGRDVWERVAVAALEQWEFAPLLEPGGSGPLTVRILVRFTIQPPRSADDPADVSAQVMPVIRGPGV